MNSSPPQIAELGSRARAHFEQGRLREARTDYEELCRRCPQDPAAWHMLGVVFGSLGDLDNAVHCASRTTQLAPSAPAGYRNLGHFLLQLGRAAEAEASFRKAVSLTPDQAADHANLGVALASQGRHAEAIDCYTRAAALNAADPVVRFNLAAACHAIGRGPDAIRHYEQALQLAPDEPRYLAGLASALRDCDRDEQALGVWLRVAQRVPDDLEALLNIGGIYRKYGRLVEAHQIYERAVRVAPDDTAPSMYLGLTQLDLGNNDKAVQCFEDVLFHDPNNAEAQYNRALSLERSGHMDEALAGYERIPPGDHGLDLLGARACILEKLGDFAAAHALLDSALQSGSAGLRSLDAYARLCRHFGECDQAIERIEARLRAPDLDDTEQRHLHFRIGELYDRQKRYDEAFRHFEAGNRLKGYRYNGAEDARYVDRLIETFSQQVFADLPRIDPVGDVTPIFIVGMPRSGTTLVEQILASHPQIHAGDELPFITRIVNAARVRNGQTRGYPDYLPWLTEADCAEMAWAYLDELRTLAPGAAYVTDKMPHNFPYLGLMRRLFPNAPIIHCLRDPVDVCLSCYFQDFASSHNYAYDLTHLGQHYRQYQRTVAHFRDVLQVSMYENRYEALTDDPETGSRALVAYCGLPWNDACLRFYKSGNKSKTASYDQVRQPIYKRSAQRWRNYERHLGPLFVALEIAPASVRSD